MGLQPVRIGGPSIYITDLCALAHWWDNSDNTNLKFADSSHSLFCDFAKEFIITIKFHLTLISHITLIPINHAVLGWIPFIKQNNTLLSCFIAYNMTCWLAEILTRVLRKKKCRKTMLQRLRIGALFNFKTTVLALVGIILGQQLGAILGQHPLGIK